MIRRLQVHLIYLIDFDSHPLHVVRLFVYTYLYYYFAFISICHHVVYARRVSLHFNAEQLC